MNIPSSNIDAWNNAEGTKNGKPILLRYRPKIKNHLGDKRFPNLLTITWTYNSNHVSGLPPEELIDNMKIFEDAIVSSLESKNNGILTHITTNNDERIWYIYIDDVKIVNKVINSALSKFPKLPIQLRVEKDENWSKIGKIIHNSK